MQVCEEELLVFEINTEYEFSLFHLPFSKYFLLMTSQKKKNPKPKKPKQTHVLSFNSFYTLIACPMPNLASPLDFLY